MHRLPPSLILIGVLLAWAPPSSAQPLQAQDAGSCEPLRRDLDAARRELERARDAAARGSRETLECRQELAGTDERLREASASAGACRKERDHLCAATAAFADELARGQSRGASETGCVSPEQQARLDATVTGWANATTWLGQLAAWEGGEADTLPRPRAAGTPVDRALQRLGRRGASFLHRRLLVEALRKIAPASWERLRGRGGAALDAWFLDASPLDPEIVAEAQHAPAGAGRPGASLTAALHLVHAFQTAAGCTSAAPDARECARARQLEQLLESTGSLVVRRRVQDIWSTACGALDADAVGTWLEDFPASQQRGESEAWREIAEAAHAKLFTCYLDDPGERVAYATWLSSKLPAARVLNASRLQRVDAIRTRWRDGGAEAKCALAVRAMQTMPTPTQCAVPSPAFRDALDGYAAVAGAPDEGGSVEMRVCAQYAQLLWEGNPAAIDDSFGRPPSADDMVETAKDMPETAMAKLRAHCNQRRGDPATFPEAVVTLATLARAFGEGPDGRPFRVDPSSSRPLERVRFDASQGVGPWLSHVSKGLRACSVLGLSDDRCRRCDQMTAGTAYDCTLAEQLDEAWSRRTRNLLGALGLLLAVTTGAWWAGRWRAARRAYARWARETATFLEGLGLSCRTARLRDLLPSRYDTLEVTLPSDPAWERWGARAAVVRAPPGTRVLERDVNHAAFVAKRVGASVVLLEHDDGASPDLSAVRAMLEWAAKGGSRAVQILPIGVERARWSKSAQDVLELVEESSLRGNPFELRGRIATSNQFFNRERLVSGLLAAAQAGHWVVVTGLRRFGKSSLALEVARRLPGPTAYVDLAGFDEEIAHGERAAAVDAILRYVCLRLLESARSRWPEAKMPAPPAANETLDAAALTLWFRELSRATREATGRPAPLLVVLDEIEQALGVGPAELPRALDVLAVVVGRLKSAVGDAALPDGSSPIGVFLASALHPLLWAPLRTLAHQSIMSSFQRVCVPCLDEDAATTMMRSLGARQGVRFTDASLGRLVAESQGVPLLLRRLGASVLELYDPERARQGGLGAVEIGVEGATEAVDRELREGSPLRVWIESEIAPPRSIAGALLRRLSRDDVVSVSALHELAARIVAEGFANTGIDQPLAAEELARRAEEAAHVSVQLLHESGLLVPHGDLTAPEAYSLPDGTIRRVLQAQASVSAFPSARPAP